MKWRYVSFLTAAAWLCAPAAASACDSYLGYLFTPTGGSGIGIGAGIQVQPGSDGEATYLIPSVDVAIPIGQSITVKPMIGYCTSTGGEEGFEEDSEIVFGAAGAFNVWNDAGGTIGLNIQAAVTAYSYEGGSEQIIPIALTGAYAASDAASIVFGAGMQIGRYSFEFEGFSDSGSDSDPFGFVGVMFGAGNIGIQTGVEIKKGDEDTDFALNAALSIPMGG